MAKAKLSDLTERELLLLLNEKVDRLEQEVAQGRVNAEKISQLEMRIVKGEVQMRIWGIVLGFVAGLAGSVISKIVNL